MCRFAEDLNQEMHCCPSPWPFGRTEPMRCLSCGLHRFLKRRRFLESPQRGCNLDPVLVKVNGPTNCAIDSTTLNTTTATLRQLPPKKGRWWCRQHHQLQETVQILQRLSFDCTTAPQLAIALSQDASPFSHAVAATRLRAHQRCSYSRPPLWQLNLQSVVVSPCRPSTFTLSRKEVSEPFE